MHKEKIEEKYQGNIKEQTTQKQITEDHKAINMVTVKNF